MPTNSERIESNNELIDQAQALVDALPDANEDWFLATYGETTYAECYEALLAGRPCVVMRNSVPCWFVFTSTDETYGTVLRFQSSQTRYTINYFYEVCLTETGFEETNGWSENGFLGDVRDSGTAIGLLKRSAEGAMVEAAVPGIDYQLPLEAGVDYQEPLQADVDYQTPLVAGTDYQEPLTPNVDYQTPLTAGTDYQTPLTAGTDYMTPPATATELPASGTALAPDTIYTASGVGTYVFTPPESGWAHGTFTTGESVAVSFSGSFVGVAPTIEASKTYEFDVLNSVWAVQEVVTA